MDDLGIHQPVLKTLGAGDVFTGFYLLREKTIGTKRDGGSYLSLDIVDRSGRLRCKVWQDADSINQTLTVGDVIRINGAVQSYQGRNEVNVRRLRPANENDQYDLSLLIPVSEVDPEEVIAYFEKLAGNFKNEKLKELLLAILSDENVVPALTRSPAGKMWHHARLGGLLEHTRGVVNVCRMLARLYPQVNKDLLLSGAMLHDVGKVSELSNDNIFDYTNKGRLLGHIVIGVQLISAKAAEIDDFPSEILDRLLHLIISHQGEFDTAKKPSIPEAYLLYFADEIDSKMDALKNIKVNLAEGETWKYVKLLDRTIDVSQLDC